MDGRGRQSVGWGVCANRSKFLLPALLVIPAAHGHLPNAVKSATRPRCADGGFVERRGLLAANAAEKRKKEREKRRKKSQWKLTTRHIIGKRRERSTEFGGEHKMNVLPALDKSYEHHVQAHRDYN